MKNKYIITIFLIGLIVTIIGALFKILHWEIGGLTSNSFLTLGMLSEVTAVILFIFKLLNNKKNDFLNK